MTLPPIKTSEVTSGSSLVTEAPVTLRSGGLELQRCDKAATVKLHRFICFIGKADLF